MTEPTSTKRRKAAFRWGLMAEYLAAAYLMAKGYRIIAIRHKTPLGEIDLIAMKGDLVAIIEVKARARLEDAVFAVSDSACRRIRGASDLWLSRQRASHKLSMRYDIIAVTGWRLPIHLIDAF